MRKLLTVLIAACAIALPVGFTSAAEPPGQPAVATCFWEGPISTDRPTTKGFDGRNFNFPEESATYWLARFNLPSDTSLILQGRYPHGRYMSLNAYSDGAPTDALSDIAIKPQPGHINPFVPGALRDGRQALRTRSGCSTNSRRHRARREPRTRSTRSPAPAPRSSSSTACTSPTAASTSPEAPAAAAGAQEGGRKHGEVRRRLRGDQRPRPLHPGAERSRGHLAERSLNPALRPADEPRLRPAALGALLQPELCAARRGQRLHRRGPQARLEMEPEVQGGFYSNRDSAYIYAHLSRDFGPLFVVRGRLPGFTRTDTSPRACPTRSFASGRSAPASRGSRPAPPTASPTTRSSTAAAATTRSWSVAARTAHPTRARNAAWPGSTGVSRVTARATGTTGC